MSFTRHDLTLLAGACIGRRNDYALQRPDGLYTRVRTPLTYEALRLHLEGSQTIGSYVIDERGLCRFAVFDADSDGGLLCLVEVHLRLAREGWASYLEGSRRGLHLRVFLAVPASPAALRRWLLPYCPAGVEFYPKQDDASWEHPGSLVRVPLGVHRLTRRRYPFLRLVEGQLVPVARSLSAALSWFSTVERAQVPPDTMGHTAQKKYVASPLAPRVPLASAMTIHDWCAGQDAVQVIGRYVALDQRGMGCCPFGWHHANGKDTHPSLWVHPPRAPGAPCWYCHTWQRGGNLFDFLCVYFDLDAKTLWRRIRAGEVF